MLPENQIKKELEACKKEYHKARKRLNKQAKLRNIDDLQYAAAQLIDLRVTISTLEFILETPYDKIFLPLKEG